MAQSMEMASGELKVDVVPQGVEIVALSIPSYLNLEEMASSIDVVLYLFESVEPLTPPHLHFFPPPAGLSTRTL
jgi:hypothetical protein